MSTAAPTLAEHPFAQGLTEGELRRLAACACEVRYSEGEFIFREGEEAGTLYLLRSGRVALEQHLPGKGAVQMESLGAGDLLGLSWLLSGGRWTLDARAVEPVEAVALDGECVRRVMGEDPALGLTLATHLIEQLYHRLVRVRMQRLDLYRPGGPG